MDAQNGVRQHGIQPLRPWPTRRRTDTKVGYGMTRRVNEEPFESKDRQAQLNAIERTFRNSKKSIRKHYSRPGVVAVEECPIPDFDVMFFQINFLKIKYDLN